LHPNILIVDAMKKEQACTEMKMEQFESGDREYWVENRVRVHYSPCLLYTRIKKNIKNVTITMADQTPSCGNEKMGHFVP